MDYSLPEGDEGAGEHEAITAEFLVDDPDGASLPELSPLFCDRLSVLAQLAALYRQGVVSLDVIEAWKRHVADNQSERVPDCPDGVDSRVEVVAEDNRQQLFKGALARFFQQNPVRVTETLGEHLRAIFFTGPRVNTIIFSSAVVQDRADTTFQAMEIFMHYVTGHLRGGTYDFMPEFRRDRQIPTQYLTPRYGEFEGKARKATCCLWDDAYSESVLDHSFLRTALRQPWITSQFIREAVHNKASFRTSLVRHLLQTPIATLLRNRIHVPPVYGGPVAVVKAPDNMDINVYLLQRVRRPGAEKEMVCRRWIPSESVLQNLGLSLDDVIRIPWDQLMGYEEEIILIHPAEVAELRSVLDRTVMYALANLLLSAESRLRGVFRHTLETSEGSAAIKAPSRRSVPISLLINRGRDAFVNHLLDARLGVVLRMAPGWPDDESDQAQIPRPQRVSLPIQITPHWGI